MVLLVNGIEDPWLGLGTLRGRTVSRHPALVHALGQDEGMDSPITPCILLEGRFCILVVLRVAVGGLTLHHAHARIVEGQ